MKVDLHVHTSRYSSCSRMTPEEALTAAKNKGLDALCFTEHNVLWPVQEAKRLEDDYGIKIFRGIEITSTGGDVLVFGVEEAIPEMPSPEELKLIVDHANGVCFAAHPFRGFLLFGIGSMDMSIEDAASNPTFAHVHGLEVCNGLVTDEENTIAASVANSLGLLKTAGSDAHTIESIGKYVLEFDAELKSELELVRALKDSSFRILLP